ncbi:hypothetical protein CRV03_05085 [Arcobacter sp. F155]|uniref:putative phage abortive infection protein n=1 Tax=Arcobacter sp. F155 TaxID=2044512 RepID=UPI00100AA5F8|nr:putative phage abortive infection protein [Arcobacter sp. F155]RXJ77607.1 hypothetical protein CRV03_05085 [Arcobacter sp. F155]
MKKDNTLFNLGLLFSAAIIFVLGIFAFYIDTFSNKVITKDTQSFAFFGDFIGGTLNPILAFLAFLALLYTIKIQSDELSATREELAKSAKAQEEQSTSLELQNKATSLQIFESTFFQLLKLHNEVINKFFIGRYSGDEALAEYLGDFYTSRINNTYLTEEELKILFNNIKRKKSFKFFRTLISILILIYDNRNKLEYKQIQNYLFIIQSQISDAELVLFYYYVIIRENGKFKFLVEKYSFFEKIKIEKLSFYDLVYYDISAFGKNQKIIDKYNELKEKSTSAKAEDL